MEVNNSFLNKYACLQDTLSLLDQQINITKKKYSNISNNLGMILGCSAAIITTLHAAVLLDSATMITRMEQKTYRFTNLNFSNLEAIYLLSLCFGWIPAGFLVGISVKAIVKLTELYKIHQITQTKMNLAQKYKKTGVIESQDIPYSLKLMDSELKKTFIEKMDTFLRDEGKNALGKKD